MSWYEITLRVVIILFGIWAVSTSVMVGYALWKKSQDED